jgi:hypothetical protein
VSGAPILSCRPSQRSIEIPANIVDVFQSDGDSHQVRRDPGSGLLLISELLVSGAAGMDDQCLGVPDIGQMRDQA